MPVLVHRFARERLHALGQVQESVAKDVPEVLLICVHNSGRSQTRVADLPRQALRGLGGRRPTGQDLDGAHAIRAAIDQCVSTLLQRLTREPAATLNSARAFAR